MFDHSTTSRVAVLSICEALLIALNDAKVLPENEIMGSLKDGATAHENAGGSEIEIENQKVVTWLKKGLSLTHLCCEGSKLLERWNPLNRHDLAVLGYVSA
jgi:hypothetical protein